jgi:autoinducer 2-degrading protein
MHAVFVSFRIKPEYWALFVTAVLANASQDAGASEILLYEVYTDAAAFEQHLAAPHFLAFDAAASDWVVEKRVRRLERIDPAR